MMRLVIIHSIPFFSALTLASAKGLEKSQEMFRSIDVNGDGTIDAEVGSCGRTGLFLGPSFLLPSHVAADP